MTLDEAAALIPPEAAEVLVHELGNTLVVVDDVVKRHGGENATASIDRLWELVNKLRTRIEPQT